MTTFRDLPFDDLLARGWKVQDGSPRRQPDATWRFTLVLPGDDDEITHAVTGAGFAGEHAQQQAVEVANAWRRRQAEQQSGEG